MEQFSFTIWQYELKKDADGMINSVDPDQTAPF